MRQGAPRAWDFVRISLIAIGAFTIGGLGVFGARGALGQQASDSATSVQPITVGTRPVELGDTGAPSAEEAVAEFLDAEVAGSQRAFDLLSEPDRARYPSVEVWDSRRKGVLGEVVSWRWVDEQQLQTEVVLVPDLSTTRGWQPAEVSIAWHTVDQQGWRISLGESLLTETVPPDDTVVESAREWLAAGGACNGDFSPQLPTVVASDPTLLRLLCDGDGLFSVVDNVEPVAGPVAAALSLRYGPDTQRWARQVLLDSSDPIALILAPIGEDWVVIDAVPSK